MSDKNRVIYQSQAVYAGRDKNAAGDTGWQSESGSVSAMPKQLKRVQSANYGFDIARTDVNQFGELARIDSIVLETPTVNFDSSWYLCNFYNEDMIGLKVHATEGILADVLSSNAGERNYYIRVVDEGSDAKGYDASAEGTATSDVIGIGNGFLTNWSCEASVGGFPTVSISAEGMNMNFNTGTQGILNPAINSTNGTAASTTINLPPVSGNADLFPASAVDEIEAALAISTLRPGDITIKIAEHNENGQFGATHYDAGMPGAKLPEDDGTSTNSANIQSYTINFDMGRTAIQRLGNRFAFAREIDFPVNVNLSFDAILTDLTTGNLNQLIDCEKAYDIRIQLDGVTGACGQSKGKIAEYYMKNMKPDAQSYGSSIGDNKTVTLDFTTQIGGPNQNNVGLYMRGLTQTVTGSSESDGDYGPGPGFNDG